MNFIIDLLVSAGVILLLAYIMPQVNVKSFLTALWIALLIGILNATVGWILRAIGNLFTLFLLSFIIRLLVTAIIIKLADKLSRNFEVKGFWPALVIAIALSIAATLVSSSRTSDDYDTEALNWKKTEQLYVNN